MTKEESNNLSPGDEVVVKKKRSYTNSPNVGERLVVHKVYDNLGILTEEHGIWPREYLSLPENPYDSSVTTRLVLRPL